MFSHTTQENMHTMVKYMSVWVSIKLKQREASAPHKHQELSKTLI